MIVNTQTTINWLRKVVREYQENVSDEHVPGGFFEWRTQVKARLEPYQARMLNDYSIEFDSEELYTLWLIRENHSC